MIDLRAVWTSLGGPTSVLGKPTPPPGWAQDIVTDLKTDQPQATTGGHEGQIAYFENGLIYWRDGLVSPDGQPAPLVMPYDTAALGGATSAQFKTELLDWFADRNGLILVNYNLGLDQNGHPRSASDPTHPIADDPGEDTNDSSWMTGQALAVVALEGDLTSAAFILRGMLAQEWSTVGDLVRYPNNPKAFSGLDPSTQIAGCYFAGKAARAAGNPTVLGLAREVINRWIDELFRCNGTLGLHGPKMLLPGLITLNEVAKSLGVEQARLDHLTLLLDEQKMALVLVTYGALSAFALLDDNTLYASCAAIEAGLDDAVLAFPKWLRVQWKVQDRTAATPLDASGLNLMFWENLVMHECTPSALLNLVTENLAHMTQNYKMMPFQWLAGSAGGVHDTAAYVANWRVANGDSANGDTATDQPSLGDYSWRTGKRQGPGSDHYNRVDYLLLRGLQNLDPGVWSQAPHHFGISFDLPIPHLGSVHLAGAVNSDGTFDLSGSETLAPLGYKLESARFSFKTTEMQVEADLQVLSWNLIHVAGTIDLTGAFALAGGINLAALGGPLAAVLNGQANFAFHPDGLAFDGSFGIPALAGSWHVHGAVHADGSIAIDGIPGNFTSFIAEEAARLWHGVGATANQVASALKGVGHAVAESAEALVKGALADLNTTATALRSVGAVAAEVADALRPLSGGVTSHAKVRTALEAANYPAQEITQAMVHAYHEIPHQDGPQLPAVDTWVIPHVDTPAGPMVNVWAIPHVDTPAGPMVNVWAIPHVDIEGPHTDTPHNDGHPAHIDSRINKGHGLFHVDSHTDLPGPHVDIGHQDFHIPPRINTPPQRHTDGPVPPHVDTPHQNHADGPVPPHIDTPHQNHLDTPPQGHIDIP